MKTMTCQQLGGACDIEFQAETFEEMAELSRQHGMEMAQQRDAAHLGAMEAMKAKMANPEAMQEWMDARRAQFDALS